VTRCWRGFLLERCANSLHMVQLMPLPPHHVCFSKIWNEAETTGWQWHQRNASHLHLAADRQPCQHLITRVFYGPNALPAAQPTASKHRKQKWEVQCNLIKKRSVIKLTQTDKRKVMGQTEESERFQRWRNLGAADLVWVCRQDT